MAMQRRYTKALVFLVQPETREALDRLAEEEMTSIGTVCRQVIATGIRRMRPHKLANSLRNGASTSSKKQVSFMVAPHTYGLMRQVAKQHKVSMGAAARAHMEVGLRERGL